MLLGKKKKTSRVDRPHLNISSQLSIIFLIPRIFAREKSLGRKEKLC